MTTFEQMKEELLSNPEVKKEYEKIKSSEWYESVDTSNGLNQRKAIDIQWDIELEEGETYEEVVEMIGLPKEIELPLDLETDEEISDYITEQSGYCHTGFDIVTTNKEKYSNYER